MLHKDDIVAKVNSLDVHHQVSRQRGRRLQPNAMLVLLDYDVSPNTVLRPGAKPCMTSRFSLAKSGSCYNCRIANVFFIRIIINLRPLWDRARQFFLSDMLSMYSCRGRREIGRRYAGPGIRSLVELAEISLKIHRKE
jgi:hypothetical protein